MDSSFSPGRIYILIVGHNSVGKSTVAGMMASALLLPVLEFGDCIRLESARDPNLGTDLSSAYLKLREQRGARLLTEWSEARDLSNPSPGLVMVGLRDLQSYLYLTQRFRPLCTVSVEAPIQERLARDERKSHSRGEDPLSVEAFLQRDSTHRSWGLEAISRSANWRIINDGSTEELRQQVEHMASQIALGF
jgi:hypothetical protein